jgi:lipopolysaccharide transport system permease protein
MAAISDVSRRAEASAVPASTTIVASADPRDRPATVIRPPALTAGRVWHSIALLPRYRDLLTALTAHRIKVRYKQSVLGPFWAILQPLAMMIIFAAVFSVISRVPSEGKPYALFVYCGLLPWTAFAGAMASAATSLVTHAPLVTRVYFPREILPVTYVAAALFDLAVASSVLLLLLAYYDVVLTPAALWTLPIVLLLAAFTTAVSLVLCAVNVRFRDIGVAMPLLLQFWMFASPVIYPLNAVPVGWRPWYLLNPMAGIVDGFRRVILDGAPPDPVAIGAAVGITVVLLPLAYVWFKYVEATMADLI